MRNLISAECSDRPRPSHRRSRLLKVTVEFWLVCLSKPYLRGPKHNPNHTCIALPYVYITISVQLCHQSILNTEGDTFFPFLPSLLCMYWCNVWMYAFIVVCIYLNLAPFKYFSTMLHSLYSSAGWGITWPYAAYITSRDSLFLCSGGVDLLTDDFEVDDTEKDDLKLLNEILNAPTSGGDDFSREWQAVFGSTPLSASTNLTPVESDNARAAEFMPSCLLDMTSGMSSTGLEPNTSWFMIIYMFCIY